MTDRSYLPYKSARYYVDRGMAKWMGFYISEHSTALSKYADTVTFPEGMESEEKMLLLNQVFFKKQKIVLYTKLEKQPFIGRVYNLTEQKLYLETEESILNFPYDHILSLTLAEEAEDE